MGCNLIESRRRILLNTPHLETQSGALITFGNGERAPLKKCAVNFDLTQPGSGDPSPSNVRPITSWTGINLHVSPTTAATDGVTYSFSWQTEIGAIYTGHGDLTAGLFTLPKIPLQYNGDNVKYDSAGTGYVTARIDSGMSIKSSLVSDYFSTTWPSGTPGRMVATSSRYVYIQLPRDQVPSLNKAGVLSWLTAYQPVILIEPNAPQTHQITPHQIKSLPGVNYIWSDASGLEITYWKH